MGEANVKGGTAASFMKIEDEATQKAHQRKANKEKAKKAA
jgi:hypothetical protein